MSDDCEKCKRVHKEVFGNGEPSKSLKARVEMIEHHTIPGIDKRTSRIEKYSITIIVGILAILGTKALDGVEVGLRNPPATTNTAVMKIDQ